MTTKKNEEVRTEPPQLPSLPKLNDDFTWDTEPYGIKYRLHEASIPELTAAAAGARSEDEKQINLLSLIVQQQDENGKWVPIVWPKGAQRLYLMLIPVYWAGIGALEVEAKKCLKTSTNAPNTETSRTSETGNSTKQP